MHFCGLSIIIVGGNVVGAGPISGTITENEAFAVRFRGIIRNSGAVLFKLFFHSVTSNRYVIIQFSILEISILSQAQSNDILEYTYIKILRWYYAQ